MLSQYEMITRLRALCEDDLSLTSALMYGSFAHGQGDEHSDIEFYLFFDPNLFGEIEPRAWIDRVAPVELFYTNELGTEVAIFDNAVRGEFHFLPAFELPIVDRWTEAAFATLEDTIVLDRTGELSGHMAKWIRPPPTHQDRASAEFVSASLLNWTLLGSNLLIRRENARALDMLHVVHTHLLRAARIIEASTNNWLTPSRRLEQDFGHASYERFRSCTGGLEPQALQLAYRQTWLWGRVLLAELSRRHDLQLSSRLMTELDQRLLSNLRS